MKAIAEEAAAKMSADADEHSATPNDEYALLQQQDMMMMCNLAERQELPSQSTTSSSQDKSSLW